MKKITKVTCQVDYQDEDGVYRRYVADAPTVDMVIEKLGTIERKIENENIVSKLSGNENSNGR